MTTASPPPASSSPSSVQTAALAATSSAPTSTLTAISTTSAPTSPSLLSASVTQPDTTTASTGAASGPLSAPAALPSASVLSTPTSNSAVNTSSSTTTSTTTTTTTKTSSSAAAAASTTPASSSAASTPTTLSRDGAELNWKFSQCFGDKGDIEEASDADIISAVEFDHTGDYFATGDRGGRIVLFERKEEEKSTMYNFYAEFQSHEPEFDCLKSVEIEEKIVKIKWLKRQNAAHFLLTTNEKVIKLWKIYQKSVKEVVECNGTAGGSSLSSSGAAATSRLATSPMGAAASGAPTSARAPHPIPRSIDDLKLPVLMYQDTVVTSKTRRSFADGHSYLINSISINSDGETFMSADDLRINLWNLNVSNQCFNIVDIRPPVLEELTEVITAAEFSPVDCNTLIYSISRGPVRLIDLRVSALCDKYAKVYAEPEDQPAKTYFTEIISSISGIRFSPDGRSFLTRDFMSMKHWDLRKDNAPIKSISIHGHLQPKLCDLYESEFIFDKFDNTFSGDGKYALTGTYGNFFQIHKTGGPTTSTASESASANASSVTHLQADKSIFKSKKSGAGKNKVGSAVRKPPAEFTMQDYQRKILHASWHPRENTIAIAATNNLFIYTT